MSVEVVKVEPRCKLCIHEKAAEINELLSRRSRREQDEEGRQINLGYVLAQFAEWGVVNPNADNIKAHLKRHIRFAHGEDAVRAAAELEQAEAMWGEAQRRVLERIEDRQGDVADRVVEMELLIYEEFRLIQLEQGVAKPLSPDQMRGMVTEKTRRKASDAQDQLLSALGSGIGMVFEKALNPGPAAPVLEPPIDAEVVEVLDG